MDFRSVIPFRRNRQLSKGALPLNPTFMTGNTFRMPAAASENP
jgi:hypothetical protein